MTQPKITDQDKTRIANAFTSGTTQVDLAKKYKVCRRTIQRVLIEKGLTPNKQMASRTEHLLLNVLRPYKITPGQLRTLLRLYHDSRIPK